DGRISDCLSKNTSRASWEGASQGENGEATWKLVTYDGTYEVWRDERTKLLWSDDLGQSNWCRAAGNREIGSTATPDFTGFCESGTYQNQTTPQSYCVEASDLAPIAAGENWPSGSTYHGAKGGMGKNNGNVRWRLPTIYDWMQAQID